MQTCLTDRPRSFRQRSFLAPRGAREKIIPATIQEPSVSKRYRISRMSASSWLMGVSAIPSWSDPSDSFFLTSSISSPSSLSSSFASFLLTATRVALDQKSYSDGKRKASGFKCLRCPPFIAVIYGCPLGLGTSIGMDQNGDPIAPVMGQDIAHRGDAPLIGMNPHHSTRWQIAPEEDRMILWAAHLRDILQGLIDPAEKRGKHNTLRVFHLRRESSEVGRHVGPHHGPCLLVHLLTCGRARAWAPRLPITCHATTPHLGQRSQN